MNWRSTHPSNAAASCARNATDYPVQAEHPMLSQHPAASSQDGPPKAVTLGPARISWSDGAELHHLGKCSPCSWNWRAAGCLNGERCKFCHLCPKSAFLECRKQRAAELKQERMAQATIEGQPAGVLHQSPSSHMGRSPLQLGGTKRGKGGKGFSGRGRG